MGNNSNVLLWSNRAFSLAEIGSVAADLDAALKKHCRALPSNRYAGVIALRGSMGAGKTTLVRALCAHWGAEGEVTSPTFGLVHAYAAGSWSIFHHDCYRLGDESEAWDMGIHEYFDEDSLNIVEWPERIPGLLPKETLLLEICLENEDLSSRRELNLWGHVG